MPVFAPPVDYVASPDIRDVASGDVNGDGKTDLVTANGGFEIYGGTGQTREISVLLGNGDGTFQPPTLSATLHPPRVIVLGNLNRDGKLDAVTISGSKLDILQGNGDGTFQPTVSYPIRSPAGKPILGDWNGDGALDIATADNNVFLGKGDGTFLPFNYEATFRPTGIASADFNEDGIPDLATVYNLFGSPGTLSIMFGRGDGIFQPPVYSFGGNYLIDVQAADWNRDGHADLIALSNLDDSLYVLFGKGDGTFQPPMATNRPGIYFNQSVIGDLDGDGKLDLAGGDFGDYRYSFPPDSVKTLAVALLGKGDGTFETELYGLRFDRLMGRVALNDFNGDGKLDIAAVHLTESGNVAVLLNQTPSPPPPSPVHFSLAYYPASGPYSIGIGDYNADGKPDISIGYGVYYGNGDGTFRLPIATGPSSPISPPTQVKEATADFNGDGIPDRARMEEFINSVTIALRNGSGGFKPDVYLFTAGSHPLALAVGDLNGDGKPDLAVADYGYVGAEGSASYTIGKTIAVLLNTTDWSSTRPPGDANGDGIVNVGDAIRLLQSVAGLQTLTAEERKAADTNCDGSVGVGDVVQLLRSVVFHQPLQACP
jgi:hypothetical protein